MHHDTPEIRALRSIAETPLGDSPLQVLFAARSMQATATAALDRAGALGEAPLVRLGQGEYARDFSPCMTPHPGRRNQNRLILVKDQRPTLLARLRRAMS